MSALQARVVDLLRGELAEEAASGFPRLQRIPYTDIIWFLDYFAPLSTAEGDDLLDGLAGWGALAFFPSPQGQLQVQELEKQHPAWARYRSGRNRPGYKGGLRYTDVKMLNMIPKVPEFGGFEGWLKNFSGLALQPRPDLLPDLSHLVAAKAALLRKLVNGAMSRRFAAEKHKQPGGEMKYITPYGDATLTVKVDFAARFTGQMVYRVSVTNPDYRVNMIQLSYERLWDANMGWDYLTEENAPRSIDLLMELVVYLANLAERVNRLA